MATEEFADFLYGACLRDWDVERERMQRYADRFDEASEVRIVGAETDLRLSLAGRTMKVDAGGANMPGGEFFGCPVEDSAEGTIAFTEFPAVYVGREMNGIRLRFERGRSSTRLRDQRGLPARDARLGRGSAPPRGARHRLQSRDHALHAQHALRREDRRYGPSGARQRDTGGRRSQRVPHPLGHRQGPAYAGHAVELDGEVVQQNGAWLT